MMEIWWESLKYKNKKDIDGLPTHNLIEISAKLQARVYAKEKLKEISTGVTTSTSTCLQFLMRKPSVFLAPYNQSYAYGTDTR